jgi:hypothetical protein
MLHFNERQREVLIDKLPDTANVVVAGTVFGQAINGPDISAVLAIGGLTLWILLMTSSMCLGKRRVK